MNNNNNYYNENSTIKTLEFIQDIISRMASNSFNLKGWTILILTAFTIFLSNDFNANPTLILVLYFPIIGFSVLDAYYLNMERRYRELYKKACEPNFKPYNLNACTDDIKLITPLCKSYFSISIMTFYIPIAILIFISYLALK